MSNGTILLYFAKNPLILYCLTRKNGETRPRGARRPGLGVIKGIGGRIRGTPARNAGDAKVCVRGRGAFRVCVPLPAKREAGRRENSMATRFGNCAGTTFSTVSWCPLGVVSDVPQAPASHIQLHPGNCTHHHTAVSSQAIIVMLVASLPIVDRLRVGVHCTCSDTRQVKHLKIKTIYCTERQLKAFLRLPRCVSTGPVVVRLAERANERKRNELEFIRNVSFASLALAFQSLASARESPRTNNSDKCA